MLKRFWLYSNILCLITMLCLAPAALAGPKGAKAIFDSGEGPTVSVSRTRTPSADTVKKEKYIGLSYQLLLLSDDGQFKVVPKTRTFKSGEKIKMLVRTNRPGYMTIMNVGPTGNTHVLFNEYVEGFTMVEVPRGTNFRFVGAPGTEKLLVMLSNEPNPIGNQPAVTAGNMPPAVDNTMPPPTSTADVPPPPPSSTDVGSLPPPPGDVAGLPPPPDMMVANIESAKGGKGAKDIVVEDKMQTSYAVISPKNNWKPKNRGTKDIVLESSDGNNYGVVPASAMSEGGILTLEIKLKHR